MSAGLPGFSARVLLAFSAIALSVGPVGAAQPGAAGEEDRQPRPAAATKEAHLTVATYNVNWGEVDLRETVAVIRRAKADLVLLQETTARIEGFLRRALDREYPLMAFRGHRGRNEAERFGILARLPVKDLRFVPPKHGLFGAWIGQWNWQGRKIQVANVHLQPGFFSRNAGVLGAMKALQQMEEVHKREIAAIYDNLAPKEPTLVMGDLNSMSSFAAPTFLAQKGFVDSFASVHEKPDEHPTWRWRTGGLTWSARIDYIFHTAHFQTVESRIVQSNASDHHLVVSRLRWREENAP